MNIYQYTYYRLYTQYKLLVYLCIHTCIWGKKSNNIEYTEKNMSYG